MAQHYKNYYGFSKGKYAEGDTIELADQQGSYKIIGIEDKSLIVCPIVSRKTLWDKEETIQISNQIAVLKSAPRKSVKAKSSSKKSEPKSKKIVDSKETPLEAIKQVGTGASSQLVDLSNKGKKQFFAKTESLKNNLASTVEKTKDSEQQEALKEKATDFKNQVKLLPPKLKRKKNHIQAEIKGKIKDSQPLDSIKLEYKRGKNKWKEIQLDLVENKFNKKIKLKKNGKYSFRVVSTDQQKKVVSKKKTATVKKQKKKK